MSPKTRNFSSVNEGNYVHLPQGVKDYIKYFQTGKEDGTYTSRYIGNLISDVHRNIIKAGFDLYPTNSKAPTGKLRLLYEWNPVAFIVEQAGGIASDSENSILEIIPTELHESVPIFCVSKTWLKK